MVLKDEDKDITVYRVRRLRRGAASGFEIWCLPSVARSLRSKQGRVIIDEAAFVDDLDELKKAAMALLMRGGCVRILSTHNGDDNPFNELVKEIRDGKWEFFTPHHDALEQGLYRRICLVQKKEWTEAGEEAWRKEIIDSYGDGGTVLRSGSRRNPLFPVKPYRICFGRLRRRCPQDNGFTFEKEERRVKEFKAAKCGIFSKHTPARFISARTLRGRAV